MTCTIQAPRNARISYLPPVLFAPPKILDLPSGYAIDLTGFAEDSLRKTTLSGVCERCGESLAFHDMPACELETLFLQIYLVCDTVKALRFELDEIDRDDEAGMVWYSLKWSGRTLEIEARYDDTGLDGVRCEQQYGLSPDESVTMMAWALKTLDERFESAREERAGL